MKQSEFLGQLKKALENDLDEMRVKEHVKYYEEYIESEKRDGRKESEVIDSLGDPWAIAKTILITEGFDGNAYQTVAEQEEETRSNSANIHVLGGWKAKAILIAFVVLIFMIIGFALSVVAALVGLFFRFAIPILVIVLIIRFFRK